MWNEYNVSFFGHRHIYNNITEIESKLEIIIKNLILEKEYVKFLVGRNGDFDILVASIIKRLQKNIGNHNSTLVLVLPYVTSELKNNQVDFEKYYDEIEICEESASAHYKSAFSIRNKYMVDCSHMVVCYVKKQQGGAYNTMMYAKEKSKITYNINDTTYS